jgi:hypothetical protein
VPGNIAITRDPVETLETLFRREGFDPNRLDFLIHVPVTLEKLDALTLLSTYRHTAATFKTYSVLVNSETGGR